MILKLPEEYSFLIYFQLGNMTIAELHKYFESNWSALIVYLKEGRKGKR